MSGTIASWRELILAEMSEHGETWADVVAEELGPRETYDGYEERGGVLDFDARFDTGYGTAEGCAFTVWTKHRVYFPKEYDGSEECCSVSRNPDGKATTHK